MIDHILCFQDESTAIKSLPRYVNEGEWNTSCCIPGLSINIPTGTPDEFTILPGWWIAIATVELDKELISLPECRVAVNRITKEFLHLAKDLNVELFEKAIVSPVFAGSNY